MDETSIAEPLSWEACRVLGSLMEKELTVPATYPMTLNALVTACNQTSGRNPVSALTDQDVLTAIDELRSRGLARVVHASHGARTTKYRQVAHEVLALEPGERAVLTLLLLRGDQTPGELRTRSDRLHRFASVEEVSPALSALAARPAALVRELPRSPGQKESRWRHLLAAEVAGTAPPHQVSGNVGAPAPEAAADLELHPVIEPLRSFLGRWEGDGEGRAAGAPFAYREVVELTPVPGKPLVGYRSATRHPGSGAAMHAESGWLRVAGGGAVELVLAQGTGLVEVAEGVFEAAGEACEVVVASTVVAATSTAKPVSSTERRYRVQGDSLTYEVAMAAPAGPLEPHLRATLRRT